MAKTKRIDKELGLRLKKARTEQKLTYDELADKSGVSSRYIKEIENHGNVPSIYKLTQLIHALNISADLLFYTKCSCGKSGLQEIAGLLIAMLRKPDSYYISDSRSVSSDKHKSRTVE